MDLCVVDWKAITPICAALIASGTALYISNKWKKQKGVEVIADEAKQIVKDLLEMTKIVNFIKVGKYSCENEYKDATSRFKSLFESNVSNILYVDDCVVVDNFKDTFFV